MKKILLLFLSASQLFLSFLHAQTAPIMRADGHSMTIAYIDSVARQLMDKGEVTGLSLGFIEGGRSVCRSYGYRNKPAKTRNDTATSIYAASLAKPLFAWLVLQLVDKGLIDLDSPLYRYLPKPLPEYPLYTDLAGDDRWKLITARHCLDHTTGFPNWRQFNPRDNKKLEIFFKPGERYAYSGEGIRLLQFVVETITGRGMEDLAQEQIFRPFGMRRTSFRWQPSFEKDYATGHDMNEDTLSKYRAIEANAAGSMETSIADYTRFVAAVLQGRGLSERSRQAMLSPQVGIYSKRQFPSLNTDTTDANLKIQLSYGLGWGLFTSPYGKAFFKEGHGDGFVHYTICFPAKKMALVILSNSANGESIFKELVERTTGVTIPWEWEGYTPYRTTVKLSPQVLQQFTGTYEGKMTATISLVNGRLKVQSADVSLPPTNLYPASDHHFFLKVMETEIEFIKGTDGKIQKAALDDEGAHYELIKRPL